MDGCALGWERANIDVLTKKPDGMGFGGRRGNLLITPSAEQRHGGTSPVRQRVGPTLKSLRMQKRMSLHSLATIAGISPSHLSRIERGLTVPSYDVLDRIADAVGSDLTALRAEEVNARAVDEELDQIFAQWDLSPGAHHELLGLSHETRLELASELRKFRSSRLDA